MSEEIAQEQSAPLSIEDRFAAYLNAPEDSGSGEQEAPEQEASQSEPVSDEAVEESPESEESPEESSSEEGESLEASEDQAESEVADEGVETISDLAKAFEVDEQEFLDHLQVESRDGEGTVSLSEVISAYKNLPASENEIREQVEKANASLRTEHDQRLGELQKLTAVMIAEVENEPSVDWELLRDSDPGEYLREKETREARRSAIQKSLDAMQEEISRRESEDGEKQEIWRQDQIKAIYREKPEWQEPESGKAAMSEVTSYLVKSGYSEDEIGALDDARSILTVWRAAQWEKLQAQKPGVKKRLRLLPRTVRAGARDDAASLSKEKEQAERVNALRKNLSETGSVDDAAALIRGMI